MTACHDNHFGQVDAVNSSVSRVSSVGAVHFKEDRWCCWSWVVGGGHNVFILENAFSVRVCVWFTDRADSAWGCSRYCGASGENENSACIAGAILWDDVDVPRGFKASGPIEANEKRILLVVFMCDLTPPTLNAAAKTVWTRRLSTSCRHSR